jgi:NADPH2:quinone reductase
MKALVSRAPGGPETLELIDLPTPEPGAGEVRVRVHAVGVNYPDVLIIEDRYQFKPERPFSPGAEVSGVVEAVGEGVTRVKPGQRVMAFTGWGAMAEQLLVHQDRCVPMPEAMDFTTGAAFLMTYTTSYHALKDRARLRHGETLLVLGASGGVGLAAVEIGKAIGARVVGAVSSEAKAEVARAAGCDAMVVYPKGPFDKAGLRALTDQFKAACGPDGANVVFDPVGGDYAEAALRAVGWEGRFLVVGFPAGIPSIPLNLTLLKGCQVLGVFLGGFIARDPKGAAANIGELLGLWSHGKLKPHVSATFPLARGGEAIASLRDRVATGKVVVTAD